MLKINAHSAQTLLYSSFQRERMGLEMDATNAQINLKRMQLIELEQKWREAESALRDVMLWLDRNDPEFMDGRGKMGFEIDKLKPALTVGPLSNKSRINSRALRDFSREWRRLIETLRLPENHLERFEAEAALKLLGVDCAREKSNALVFIKLK